MVRYMDIIFEFLSYTFCRHRWDIVRKVPTGFYTDGAMEYNVLYQHCKNKDWKHWGRKWIWYDN
jgi:hypothetical protein